MCEYEIKDAKDMLCHDSIAQAYKMVNNTVQSMYHDLRCEEELNCEQVKIIKECVQTMLYLEELKNKESHHDSKA